jgi:hypothetical protein
MNGWSSWLSPECYGRWPWLSPECYVRWPDYPVTKLVRLQWSCPHLRWLTSSHLWPRLHPFSPAHRSPWLPPLNPYTWELVTVARDSPHLLTWAVTVSVNLPTSDISIPISCHPHLHQLCHHTPPPSLPTAPNLLLRRRLRCLPVICLS